MTDSRDSGNPIRVGTRGGALALAQAEPIAAKLGGEIVVSEPGGDNMVARLRESLRKGEVDVVVHSFNDLPSEPAEGLTVAAVPKRADARDALCARDGLTFDALPSGARIATGSPLRRAQVMSRRIDVEVVDLGGDVDSRLAPVLGDDADFDAIVVAAAALERLHRLDAVTEFLGIDGWPTAPAQGALALEVRRGDEKLVAKLDHRPSRLAVDAERGVLALLAARCAAPIAAHALFDDGLLFLSARVYSLDGGARLTSSHALYPEDVAHPAADLAQRVADELLAAGAADLVAAGSAADGDPR